ncbi:peptidyl-alpha-hydroxyglycine alpha-amidating lyase 1 isoform X1 [Lucilia cuprina]|uniref:peptidyl-alpha-hydroxyglycine alpha-amidating lyase 1 isoform X1 n=1 Tax=Lucilia cuprina TaxID=7375 RepID=UPI001F05A0F3|nr:peptidyl-alpha-hydroxyglycine alpha-amidating lyase 1 isoform X1 [Lucilia cuprina]
MRLSIQQQLIGPWLIVLTLFIIESATDEKLSLQRYFPLVTEEQMLNNDKRFQQIMQGSSSSSSDAIWPDKHKFEKVDVKKEINKLNITYVYQSSWPEMNVKLGSVTAVSFDKAGNVVIFHRCDRVWEQDTFSRNNVFTKRNKGAIRDSTVLALARETGKLIYDWGKNLFYMPHGLTIDHEDNVWITDVALHQVFKFGPRGSNDKPLMTLGTAFTPGAGETKFCKPTSVAVLENGDFFVADGYCNARILKYTKEGEKILHWGQNTFSGVSFGVAPQNFFAIPHALTLVPEQELICAADRENGRVQCFYWSNGTFHSQYHSQIIGDRLFSMDYTPAQGGKFIIVNGPTAELGLKTEQYNEVRGYVMDFSTKKVTGKFGPNDMEFSNPHDVAVTKDGNEVYVAELNPMRIHKFLHKSMVKSIPLSAAKTTANVEIEISKDKMSNLPTTVQKADILSATDSAADPSIVLEMSSDSHHRPGATAILVASLMLLFAFLTFGLALLIARRRKRGCMPFGSNNRRHAWDFPSKPDGFKLGGLLLERNKRSGFEKLDQNASDEETETATNNTLTSAQFA